MSLSKLSTSLSSADWYLKIFFLADTYSSMDLCTSRWLGEHCHNRNIRAFSHGVQLKLLSSRTTLSVSFISSILLSKGMPIFPPSQHLYPCSFSMLYISVVVVVLPSLPVTAKISAGKVQKILPFLKLPQFLPPLRQESQVYHTSYQES